METILNMIYSFSGWLWGPPLIILLSFGGVFLTIKLNFIQFRYAGYILKSTFGKIGQKSRGEGTISPFQSLTSALACTVGAGNIVGVPAAIVYGGPGGYFLDVGYRPAGHGFQVHRMRPWPWLIARKGRTANTLAVPCIT